ncbi:MAG TPA: tocopherol cyclase family protein [Spirochaetota bacterium]|nr:tocopherol cyclase family protein [Spirochaetota bacterium]
MKGWPVKLLSPGIMGWYGLVGFMECYYHVLSFKHRINGFININGETIDFDDGWGYIEKNWGTSFPSSWVWIQSNQFNENENSAFMFSVAKIPFLNMKFNGFVGGLLHNNKFYPFATYNGSKIKNISINDNSVNIEIASTKYLLKINAERKNGFYLPYPTNSGMDGKILESLKSNLTIELSEKKSGNLIFKGNSDFTGLEISDRAKNLM